MTINLIDNTRIHFNITTKQSDEIYGNLDRKTAANIRQLLLSLSQTLIEVSHQVDGLDLTDYTKVLQITNSKLVEL